MAKVLFSNVKFLAKLPEWCHKNKVRVVEGIIVIDIAATIVISVKLSIIFSSSCHPNHLTLINNHHHYQYCWLVCVLKIGRGQGVVCSCPSKDFFFGGGGGMIIYVDEKTKTNEKLVLPWNFS